MLVVADTSPISILAEIGCLIVLPELFHHVLIPPQVATKLVHPKAPAEARALITHPPDWLEIRQPQRIQPILLLDPGEEAAINLARESRADLLLMDDREARLTAERFGLRVIGAVGILEEAADAGLLDLKEVFRRIRQTRFFISEQVLEETLQRQVRKNPPSH